MVETASGQEAVGLGAKGAEMAAVERIRQPAQGGAEVAHWAAVIWAAVRLALARVAARVAAGEAAGRKAGCPVAHSEAARAAVARGQERQQRMQRQRR